MALHLDLTDPRYREAAAEILRRHDAFELEANITTAVRDFLILTGLARSDEIGEENPPSDGSRSAVDLTALDTFVEFKRRIGTVSGGGRDPENVRQLDEYLAQSAAGGKVRMGILTDGKRWVLRWPGAGDVRGATLPCPSPSTWATPCSCASAPGTYSPRTRSAFRPRTRTTPSWSSWPAWWSALRTSTPSRGRFRPTSSRVAPPDGVKRSIVCHNSIPGSDRILE